MFTMSQKSRDFLKNNIPEALQIDAHVSDPSDMKSLNKIFDLISDWIDLNGFRQDGYYNEKGKIAQAVYDDLFNNN